MITKKKADRKVTENFVDLVNFVIIMGLMTGSCGGRADYDDDSDKKPDNRGHIERVNACLLSSDSEKSVILDVFF